MPVATINGQTIAYEVQGDSGPPILFVHGWACNKEMWITTLQQMEGLGRCYAIDLLGHGDSSKPDPAGNGYAIRAQMQTVADFIEHVIGMPCRYVGHSMGGMIGLVLAHDHPALVTRLALLSPAVTGRLIGFMAGYLRMLALPAGDLAFDALFRWTKSDVARLDWFCRVAYFSDRSMLDRAITEGSFPGFRKTTSAILARMLHEIHATNLMSLLPAITTPTLIIHGREDNVVPVTDGLLAVSKMPNASIVELDGVNHVADLEGRERCWGPLRAFLEAGGEQPEALNTAFLSRSDRGPEIVDRSAAPISAAIPSYVSGPRSTIAR